MKIIVLYDSFFNNTKQIAEAIGKSIAPNENVSVFCVTDMNIKQLTELDLFIVGSPTRGFRPTEAIINFLKTIPSNGLKDVKFATFDTRFSISSIDSKTLRIIVKTGGYAAKSIAKKLKKKGGKQIIKPEGFYVKGEEGPLLEEEIERAKKWANIVGEKVFKN